MSYTAKNLDQYTAVGAVTPTYDGNGNLTFDGTFTYGYDAESRLTSVTQGGTMVATYAYDALGHRKSKTVGTTTAIYVRDPGNRALLDYNGATGAVLDWYAFGAGPNDALTQLNVAASTRTTYIPDLLGSVIGALDSGTGAITKTGYQPYGESPSTAGTFRYTGARIDAETNGLYDFRARMYSPVLGRFLQADPIGVRGGMNLYGYVGNDPLNGKDPSGLCLEDACAVEGGAALYGLLYLGVATGMCVQYCQPALNSLGNALNVLGDTLGSIFYNKPPANAWDPNGPKAPGYPGGQPDYEDPKGGPNWVPNPNGRGYGWEDASGNVWVPTGQGDLAHGGPHWDVQDPRSGDYENVYPKPSSFSSSNTDFDQSTATGTVGPSQTNSTPIPAK